MENTTSKHTIYTGLSQNMSNIKDSSIELVVTSPPYPMIEMWDEIMSLQNSEIRVALDAKDGNTAFELMHKELDKVWCELNRVVIPGGIVCINIGDATRTINGSFALYPNHARITNYFISNGFVNLPNILWRKQTNAPNKFMGSGMLPAGAYVTLEHEWVLIFRKGGKREFKTESDKQLRRISSYFWEERNIWFSDLWHNIKGTKQLVKQTNSRERSAAYPFEIPYRLINMYSVKGDTVLDPFAGTGTTTLAAISSGRNSFGYDIDKDFTNLSINNITSSSIDELNTITSERLKAHKQFIAERLLQNKEIKHYNSSLDTPVMTSQEANIEFQYISKLSQNGNTISIEYTNIQPERLINFNHRKRRSNQFVDDSQHLFSEKII